MYDVLCMSTLVYWAVLVLVMTTITKHYFHLLHVLQNRYYQISNTSTCTLYTIRTIAYYSPSVSVTRVMRTRETRVPSILSHILIGLSLFALPLPLQYIPRAVLDGIFLYLAIAVLDQNQMWERVQLFFTEQVRYELLLV